MLVLLVSINTQIHVNTHAFVSCSPKYTKVSFYNLTALAVLHKSGVFLCACYFLDQICE